MADTVIALPKYGKSGGQTVPIKAVDNGDGTYSIGTSGGVTSAITVAFPQYGVGGAEIVPMATVDNLDGTYSLKTA